MATETKNDVIKRDLIVIMEHEEMSLGAFEDPSGLHGILYTFAIPQNPLRHASGQGRNSRNSSESPAPPMLCFVVLPSGCLSIKSEVVVVSDTKSYVSNLAL
jgi:hypothetical protein